jgi:hypothetical protein
MFFAAANHPAIAAQNQIGDFPYPERFSLPRRPLWRSSHLRHTPLERCKSRVPLLQTVFHILKGYQEQQKAPLEWSLYPCPEARSFTDRVVDLWMTPLLSSTRKLAVIR